MEVLITRNMTIATDEGTARQFVKGDTPDISHSEFARLKRVKAATLPSSGTQDEEPGDDDHDGRGETEGVELDEMSKAELLAYADANDIDVDPKASKAVILEKIKASAE